MSDPAIMINIPIKITDLLERKKEIDALPADRFVETQRWLCEAVELLLYCELAFPETEK
jgi:hypothetical protein